MTPQLEKDRKKTRCAVNGGGGILLSYLANYYNSLSLSSCAFAAAFSASSKTKVFSDSTSLGPACFEEKKKDLSLFSLSLDVGL